MKPGDELTEHDRPTTDDLLPEHTSDIDDDDLSAPEVAVDSDADAEALAESDRDPAPTGKHLANKETASPDRTVVTNGRPMNKGRPSTTDEPVDAPLFAEGEVEQFRNQWRELQSTFVDSPRQAVQEADVLVAQVMQNLAATFADHKHSLEAQWSRGDEAETEELRLALRRYRSFFNQLLAV